MHQSVTALVGSMYRVARYCGSRIFALHLAYVALGLILFTPLLGLLGHLILLVSGKTMLADMEIIYFFISPYGFVAAMFFGALLVTILVFEQASMNVLWAAAATGVNCSPLQALRDTAARAFQLFSFSAQLMIRTVLICLPFLLTSVAIAWLLLTDYDINYYLSHKPPSFMLAAALIGLLLVSMIAMLANKLIDWALSLPLLLFAEVNPGSSFRASAALARKHKPLLFSLFIAWGISALLLGSMVLGFIQLIGAQVAPLFFNSISLLVVVLGTLAVFLSLANLMVTTINAGSLAGLQVTVYEHIHGAIEHQFSDRHRTAIQLSTFRAGLLIVLMVIISVTTGYWLIDDIRAVDDTIIVAHRGAAGKAPENTLASIMQAIEDGADWVEFDVQETSDGEVVVVHDSDFMKLAGINLKVWEATFSQIQDIDIGSWFAPEFAAERVPTLREVLNKVKGKGRVVIELKYYGHDDRLEQRVIDLVELADMAADTTIMSLKYEGVQKVRSLRPNWPVGLLSVQTLGDTTGLDVTFLAVNMNSASPHFIRRAQAAGKQVFVWTVNDQVSMTRMMSLGVDGIITDEPEMARIVLRERAEMNSVERLLLHAAVLLGQPLPARQYRDESP